MATKKTSTKKSAKKVTSAKSAKVTQPVVKRTVTRQVSTTRRTTDIFANAPLGALFGEFVGTFLLAAVVIATQGSSLAVFFGLVVIVLVVGHLSGAHVNPAITFGAWITRKVTTKRAVFYILAQFLGAMFAYVLLNYLISGGAASTQMNALGQAGPSQAPELFKATQVAQGREWQAIVAGIAGLSIFAFAVASAIREKKEHIAAAFTVGGGLFIGLIVAGQAASATTNAAQVAILNPAVALALQAFSVKGDGAVAWAIGVHVVAPLVGAAIGFLLYDLFRKDVDQVL